MKDETQLLVRQGGVEHDKEQRRPNQCRRTPTLTPHPNTCKKKRGWEQRLGQCRAEVPVPGRSPPL